MHYHLRKSRVVLRSDDRYLHVVRSGLNLA